MYDNESLSEAARQIQRNTVFAVFPLCSEFFPHDSEGLAILQDLKMKHDKKTISWADFSKAWKKIYQNNHTGAEKTIQKIFDKHARKEEPANKIIFDDYSDNYRTNETLKLYYLLENKNFQQILSFIKKNYKINAGRFFEKCNEFSITTEDNDILYFLNEYNLHKPKKSNIVIPKELDKNKIWALLFSNISRWDDLLDYVTLLIPLSETLYDTDQLYDALMALQITKAVSTRRDLNAEPVCHITTCRFCWRPALVRDAPMSYRVSCPIHSKKSLDGRPGRSWPYQRAKDIDKQLRRTPKIEHRLTADLMDLFPTPTDDENLFWIHLGHWKWWTHVAPNDISPFFIGDETISRILDRIPHARRFLENRKCDLLNIDQIIKTLMPLREGADAKENADYQQWISVWRTDFRYFLPVLARTEVWLAAFSQLFPNLKPDD